MTNTQIVNKIIKAVRIETLIIQSINNGKNEYSAIMKYVQNALKDASITDVAKAMVRLHHDNYIERIGKLNMEAHMKFIKAWNVDPLHCKVKRPPSKYRLTKLFLTSANDVYSRNIKETK